MMFLGKVRTRQAAAADQGTARDRNALDYAEAAGETP
jgi:hypothetical protein